jgi:hypothetical protein
MGEKGREGGGGDFACLIPEPRNIFWAKILQFFDVDPGSGMEKIRIRDLR